MDLFVLLLLINHSTIYEVLLRHKIHKKQEDRIRFFFAMQMAVVAVAPVSVPGTNLVARGFTNPYVVRRFY